MHTSTDINREKNMDSHSGKFWKWIALEDGVLYVLLGDEEKDTEIKKPTDIFHGAWAGGWAWGGWSDVP